MNKTEKDKLEALEKQVIPAVANTGLKAMRLDPEGIKILMPLKPNENHVGIMYGGSLFILAEFIGGAVYEVYFKREDLFPIVTGFNIKFTFPARTDVTCEYCLDSSVRSRILEDIEGKGKANYDISLELKDSEGNVVAVADGFYQIRKGTTL